MEQVTQQRAPLLEAMQAHRLNRVVRFDVPGHKGGRGNHELAEFLGADCVRMDVNSMKNLDNLCHPVSVIRDAQQLAAEAFGAKNAFFIINGATGASQAMIFSTCKAGDKLIMPRNVHRVPSMPWLSTERFPSTLTQANRKTWAFRWNGQ